MALGHLISPLLLLSLVVICSANPNYDSYAKNPDTNDQDLLGLDLDGLLSGDKNDHKSHSANYYKKEEEYKHHHLPTNYQKPITEGNPEYHVPNYESLNNYRVHEGLSPYTHVIGVEGIILCKSGIAYTPIQGARAIIICQSSYANGYNYNNGYYVTSSKTDEKGCFVATLSMEELAERSINLKECKAYLEYSPIQTCNYVAANNGAYLSPTRNVGDETYYNVGSLVYTEEPRHYVNYDEPKDYPSVKQPHY